MTIFEFIEKAVEGGWKPSDYGNTFYEIMEDFDKEMVEAEADGLFKKEGYELATSYLKYAFTKGREYLILLDPLAWKAVAKTGALKDPLVMWEKPGLIAPQRTFEQNMHEMVHALIEGKTIEEYLSTL